VSRRRDHENGSVANLYRTDIPFHVAEVIRSTNPELKRFVRAALDSIAANPESGEPLQGELNRYWKYRVRRLRIVYEIDRKARRVRILSIGHRHEVYEDLAARLKKETS
jgi:mRNA-degrading endonuclease RelE of RelBE toxin-antitoxin system